MGFIRCSAVRHDETYIAAAARRLSQELAIDSVSLRQVDVFKMNEGGHLKFISLFLVLSQSPTIKEPDHVAGLAWRSIGHLEEDLSCFSGRFTDTFRFLFGQYVSASSR